MTWFLFRLPGATTYVPAPTVTRAREVLRKNGYDGAPVMHYPCVGEVMGTREEIAAMLATKEAKT